MRNILLTIEYDGTNYSGWQKQNNAKTIEDKIISKLTSILNEEVEFFGASRTDRGVHALGQTASFKTSKNITTDKITKALNALLPNDIVILKSEEVNEEFNARFSCVGKKYIYKILNGDVPSAINRNFAYYYNKRLDFGAMSKACKCFEGEHDFSAFKSTGSSRKTSIRTVFECKLLKNNNFIELHISGDKFLYNMIRIIAGTLIEVGLHKIDPENIHDIILSKNRKLAGKTAPPHGLYLIELYYNK